MHLLYDIILIFIYIPSYLCQNNLTYVLSHINENKIYSVLHSNGSILTNSSYVHRLSLSGVELLDSMEFILSSSNATHSIAFSWNKGDCSLAIALALKYELITVSSPICFSELDSSIDNLIKLLVTNKQLASAATLFMNQYSLTYFSIIISDSNNFYFNLAEEFSAYLTEKKFILEQILFQSSFPPTSNSLRSKVYYILCSYDDEFDLYSKMVTYSKSTITNNIIFIFLRWSPHFITFYTKQFLRNTTSIGTSGSFPILHLLPIDAGSINSFNEIILNYEQQILSETLEEEFSDDVIFILNELESVEYLRQLYLSSFLTSVTLDGNHQRSFKYLLIGRQCNYTWTVFKTIDTINSIFENIDTNLSLCTQISYPNSDTITTSDTGWQILRIVLFSLLGVLLACTGALIAFFVIRARRARKQMSKGPNKIILLPDDLMFVMPKGSIFTSKINLRNEIHERSNLSLRSGEIHSGKTARYNGDLVEVKQLHIGPLSLRTKVMRELRQLKDLRHENLNTFLGLYIDQNAPALIFEYGDRGSLEDILKKEEIKLDWNFKWSMLNDLVRGMRYLSNSSIRCHGNLKSRNCIVDSRWVLKITDYRLNEMYSLQNAPRQVDIDDLLWMAPEHVRTTIIKNDVATIITSSAAGDVYSFGIIMQEVILRGPPYCMLDLTPQEIIAKIKKPPPLLRPSVSKQTAPPEYINSMKQCWAEQAESRPSFNDLAQSIKLLNGGKKVNIVDTMFKMLEQYSNNLEELIRERTTQLEEEKKKTDKLLSQMLPPSVADSLKSGKAVEAVWFECVTIYFSDIVGFTTISALSGPMEVVDLLNDLYTMFDSILEDFDCYKVETIGDAYMVVSGLPIQNGTRHASEIATMALTLLHACGKFKIRHMPGVPLRLRIGLHSGACVAGVVGLKMPRYCLFGDTVNTASRMESTSIAFRIHTSETTAGLLEAIGGFNLEYRGITEIKGRGNYKTYWLCGKDGFNKELPEAVISDNNHGLDEELVRLVEERRAQEQEATKNKTINDQIQVKPIIETLPEKVSASASTKMNKNDKIDDLLKFTSSSSNQQTLFTSNSTTKNINSKELPAKLQQHMNGPTRKSTKYIQKFKRIYYFQITEILRYEQVEKMYYRYGFQLAIIDNIKLLERLQQLNMFNTTCKGQCPKIREYYIGLKRLSNSENPSESK
ncbi:unnamed protein product [Rotaria sordida]|uniref:Guanylate cyclase n=1 Tax=Rotaria sordida TaxID=392033 RepID=A0A815VG25_9BILA|nr:unnamed protein product [Rotaria sordida]CAF1529996.1 unnamed protein product [Rotaria sordida]